MMRHFFSTVSGAAGHPLTGSKKNLNFQELDKIYWHQAIKVLEPYVGTNRRSVKNCNGRPGDFRHKLEVNSKYLANLLSYKSILCP